MLTEKEQIKYLPFFLLLLFFPVNGTGKVTSCYQSINNGPFSLSLVMVDPEIEGKAGLCKVAGAGWVLSPAL